jgi:hypothetical protein
MRWVNNPEKRRWMPSLAMLMEVIGDNSTILKTDRSVKNIRPFARA